MGLPLVDIPNDLASQRVTSLSTASQGKGRLYRVEKFDAKDDRQTTMENEVGNDEAAGFVRKPGGYTITFEFYEQQGNPWPDWDALVDSQEPVTITDQIVGGKRRSYGPAKVSKADRSGDKDGSNTVSVEIVALSRPNL